MIKYSFAKMNGAGNDFIAFDRDENQGLVLSSDFVKWICDRNFGIGGDGVITIKNEPDAGFSMEYFNADGSTGSLCGNGARCAIRFASVKKKFTSTQVWFTCLNEKFRGELVYNDLIKFYLQNPKDTRFNFALGIEDRTVNAHFTDTGSPHVVIRVDEFGNQANEKEILSSFDVDTVGRKIRFLKDFQPGGTNVNFYSIDNGVMRLRTYERGVEAETLACGTGSVATAIVGHLVEKLPTPVTVIPTSGKKLLVDFAVIDGTITNVSLTGPAEINFTGEFEK